MSSTANLKVIVDYVDKASGQLKKTKGGFGDLAKSMAGTLMPAVTVAAAVGVVAKGLQFAAKQAAEAEVAQAKLNAVLDSTGMAAGLSADELNSMSTEMSRATGISDELLTEAQAVMLTFTKIGEETFPGAMQAAMDMSTVLGTDLQGSVTMIGKALQDPIKGITALGRAGVTFSEDQKALIESLIESNDLMGAQQVILDELQTEYGGAAEAAGDTYAGAMNKAKEATGNFAESIGNDLIPALKEGAEWYATFVNGMADHEDIADRVVALQNLNNDAGLEGALILAELNNRTLSLTDADRQLAEIEKKLADNMWKTGDAAEQQETRYLNLNIAADNVATTLEEDIPAAILTVSESLLGGLDEISNYQGAIDAMSQDNIEAARIANTLALAQGKIDAETWLLNQNLIDESQRMQDLNEAVENGTISKYGYIDALKDGNVTQEEYNSLMGIGTESLEAFDVRGEGVESTLRNINGQMKLFEGDYYARLFIDVVGGVPKIGGKYVDIDPDTQKKETGKYDKNAFGGDVFAGQPTIVGEGGVEMFVPKTDGQIISNPQIKEMLRGAGGLGGQNVTNVFNLNANYKYQDEKTLTDTLRQLRMLGRY